MKKCGFLIALVLVFCLCDWAFGRSAWIRDSGYFWLNDFELTQRDHPERVWDKVVYGSSELISGYREDLSSSGYVNLGMDYATVVGLEKMLRIGCVHVGSELVIACNWGLMCDTLDTNPTYPWNRRPLEPYVYFQRDRLAPFLQDTWKYLLREGEPRTRAHLGQQKELYHGSMSAEELESRVVKLNGLFFANGLDDYAENLAALPKVFDWCRKNGVHVRVLWLPEHPDAPLGEVNDALRAAVAECCAAKEISFTDLTDALEPACFYDTGHMDYEYGAVKFTEVFDKWAS